MKPREVQEALEVLMDKETFIKLVENYQKFSEELKAWDNLGINMFESPLVQLYYEQFATIMDSNFNSEDIEFIDWWLNERISPDGKVNKAYVDGVELKLDAVEDLWESISRS